MKKSPTTWTYKLRLTQQEIYQGIKALAENCRCPRLKETMMQVWFSGFDMNLKRLLPDGTYADGAPTASDLNIRNSIMDQVRDGLKSRMRPGFDTPKALFALTLSEYDLLLALVQTYFKAEDLIKSGEINPYDAATLETAAYTMLHVYRHNIRYDKPLDDDDLEACEI